MGDNLQLNIMKIKLFLSIISVICFFSLVGCAPKESNTNNSKETKKVEINMGAMPTPDSAPLYVAQRKGYFKDEGIDINLTLFKDALKRDAAVSSGKLDGTVTDLVMYTSYIKGNTGWKLGTSLTGKFGIVSADKNINDFKELQGKTLGMMSRSVINYYLSENLEKNGLSLSDVTEKNVPDITTRLQMIAQHKIDATVVPEPFLTMAKSKGLNVFGVSDPSKFSATALAFNPSISKNKKLQTKFYKAYNKAVDDLNAGDDKSFRTVLSKDLSLPDSVSKNIEMPKYQKAKPVSEKTFGNVLSFCKNNDIFTKHVNPKNYIINIPGNE